MNAGAGGNPPEAVSQCGVNRIRGSIRLLRPAKLGYEAREAGRSTPTVASVDRRGRVAKPVAAMAVPLGT